MKYSYKFNNEEVTIEVNENEYEILVALDREEYNSNRKHSRRYPLSFDSLEYEDSRFADDTDILKDLIKKSDTQQIKKAIQQLLPQQQELIYKTYYCERSIINMANEEKVTEAAIRNRLKKIYRKLEKILE